MTKGYIVTFFMNGGRVYYIHKDGFPTLNRDSAYVFPDYDMAKRHAEICKNQPNRFKKWGFGFLAAA